MAFSSFSLKYAMKTIYRRKTRNVYAILGITLGVSLLLGVQISQASTEAGWEYFFLRSLGDYEAQLVPIQEPYFNESAAWDFAEAVSSLSSIDAISGRLVLSVTAFQPISGRLELGVPLLGIPINESGFGEFLDVNDRKTINLNQSDPLLIGKNLAEELDVQKGSNLILVFAEGNFSVQIERTVDYIFRDEGRGREYAAGSIVMRLDALQPVIANQTGYQRPINNIFINFDDSIESEEEAESVLNTLKSLGEELFQGNQYRQVLDSRPQQNSVVLDKFPQAASVSVFQFLDENLSSTNWAVNGVALNLNASIANITNTRNEGAGFIEYVGLNLNTTTLGDCIIYCRGEIGNSFRVVVNRETENELIFDENLSSSFQVFSTQLNSSYQLNSLAIFPVESNSQLSIDYVGIGHLFAQNMTALSGSELTTADQFVIDLDNRQIELSDDWQTVYPNAVSIMVNYEGTRYRRDYSGGFFYYSNIKYYVVDIIEQLSNQLNDLLLIFGSLIILAGLLLIVNIQLMSVEERQQQIGILRAIGTKRKQVIQTVILETILLGFIGSMLGLIGGYIYGVMLVYAQGWAFEYPAHEIPIIVTITTVQLSFIIGFVISLLTSVLPAMRASNINIVEVIRGIKPPEEQKLGRKGMYFGILLTIVGIFLAATSGLEPWQGQEAWRELNNAEVLFFIILLPVVGIALTASYFFSRRWSLNVVSFALLAWPIFNGFVIVDWVKEGTGGVYYIIGM
ncbi:MAG: FtsX-like permease family protein, partial [Candidatus Hodarchaeota archaeon]